jgi:hypothetical protein
MGSSIPPKWIIRCDVTVPVLQVSTGISTENNLHRYHAATKRIKQMGLRVAAYALAPSLVDR